MEHHSPGLQHQARAFSRLWTFSSPQSRRQRVRLCLRPLPALQTATISPGPHVVVPLYLCIPGVPLRVQISSCKEEIIISKIALGPASVASLQCSCPFKGSISKSSQSEVWGYASNLLLWGHSLALSRHTPSFSPAYPWHLALCPAQGRQDSALACGWNNCATGASASP